uniref:Monodehydroascorbate reductase n=1 Tax=Tanacetum cinerariifolium TaxID=118510 RepID=A0A699GIB5_TANCI|nr:monodehydroascorbate reductase [Tanacetum cinerariifolium]
MVTADVPEIYMQEIWATATVHHHSIRFKMNNKKRIVNLEYFREMLHICPRIPNQPFDELPFKEEILAFLRNLSYSEEIKKITDANINKLHQPWRSFVAVINKCQSGKSTGYDNLRLSQAQILWGVYHKKNVDFAYLLWEDFVYQVEHKDAKKRNEMYYPRFIKVIVNFVMIKDPSIPRRNKFGAILPVELTNEAIRNSAPYKEYYAIASGAEPPKTKASIRKTQSSFNTTMPPPVAKGTRLQTSSKVDKLAKGKQPAKSCTAKGLTVLSEVALTKAKQIKLATKRSLTQTHISQASEFDINDQSDDESHDDQENDADQEDDDDQDDEDDDQTDSDNNGDDFVQPKFSTHHEEAKDEESFDPIVQTLSHVKNSNDEGNDDVSHCMNVGGDKGPDAEDDDNELHGDLNINLEGRDVKMTDVHTTQVLKDTHVTLTLVNPNGQQQSSSVTSQFVSNMLNPSPDTGIDSLFESTPWVDVPVTTTVEPLLLTALTLPPPSIRIISQIHDHRMNEAVKVAVHLQSDKLRDEAQAKNEDFLNKLDENIHEIIKEQVKEQVKVQVSKILPKIKKTVNEQLGAEVLTPASNSSKTSYAVVADLSELKLKKILIEKMESNKSIHRSYQQKNIYKALVDAYECDKIILDTYEDTVTLKRHRDEEDKDEKPSAGSDWGSKRRRAGKEPESTSPPKEKASKTSGKYTEGSKSYQKTASESAPSEEPMQTIQDLEEPAYLEFETATHGRIQPWISDLGKQADSRTLFSELMDSPVDFLAFPMNQLNVDTTTPELLAGPTYELMKGSCKSLVELEFFLEEIMGTKSRLKTRYLAQCGVKYRLAMINMLSEESLIGGANVNNSMVLLSTGNLLEMSTPNVESSLSPNFKSSNGRTTSIWIGSLKADQSHCRITFCFQRLFKNVHKKHRHLTAYGRSSISDDTLNDVRTALDDRLKGIRMKYLPQTILIGSDKERATAMTSN